MTTNKPEVVLVYRTDTGGTDKMVCLSDYEALQAELARELQRRFDGNEQSSREHREEIAVLVEALEALLEVQDEDCRYDHEGYCQSHNLDHVDDGCRVARAKTALAAHRIIYRQTS